jgi:AAA+ ATPase superfamily predicted ATPase
MTKKKSIPLNPFLLTGYVSPEYFCDREQETQKLISALHNGRNVTLISPRRMGKTGLIRHIFHQMETEKQAKCYYVDLYKTDSLSSLVEQLASVVLGTLDTTEAKIIKQVTTFFKSLRPLLSFDSLTGVPTFMVDVKPELAEHSLAEIFSYLEQSGHLCIIAMDEFQTIADYRENNMEALLRSHIQHLSSVHFIFSGSQRHVLEDMFASANRPFYQSTQIMNLYEIEEQSYFKFAKKKLEAHHQLMDATVFDYLYHQLAGHTWYVQMALNRLYESNVPTITTSLIDTVLNEIVDENEATFQTFMRLVTPAQTKLLRAIAKEGSVMQALSHSFINQYNLGATSTIRSAIKTLVEKELLLDTQGAYQVYDRFFALWLKR